MQIHVGDAVPAPHLRQGTRLLSNHPRLDRFLHVDALAATLLQGHGLSVIPPPALQPRPVFLPLALFSRPIFLTGPSGSGKSRLTRPLLSGLLAAGYSIVAIDPKWDSILDLVSLARRSGVPPERLFLFSPQAPAPRWPLFLQPLPARQLVNAVVQVLEASAPTPGARRHDIFTSTGHLVCQTDRSLSLDEMLAAIENPRYAEALRVLPGEREDPFAWAQADASVRERSSWSRSVEAEARPAATRLMRDLLNSELTYGALCAEVGDGQRYLNLSHLWRQPTVVILHLNVDALGQQTTGLLAALLLKCLFAMARQIEAPQCRVIALVDELPQLAGFVTEDLLRIISLGRSMWLQVIAAAQFAGQLPPELADSLLRQASIQAFFRMPYADARLIASAVTAGMEPRPTLVTLDAAVSDSGLTATTVSQPIVDGDNRPLRVKPAAWTQIAHRFLLAPLSAADLAQLSRGAGCHLFVREWRTGKARLLSEYLRSIYPAPWWISGPNLRLTVQVPRVKIVKAAYQTLSESQGMIERCLMELPEQHALLRVGGATRGILRVVDVPDTIWTDDDVAYLQQAYRINGQTREQVLATLHARRQRRDDLIKGRRSPTREEVSDGSQW